MQHQFEIQTQSGIKKLTSSLVQEGQDATYTAMAKTVGLPAALAARMVLTGKLDLTGCEIPTRPSIYEPVLKDLAADGIAFVERVVGRGQA